MIERNYSAIAGALPMEERLLQLAEECAELSQAALKLRRAMTGVNPTPRSEAECVVNLMEEIGDVYTCVDIIAMELGPEMVARRVEETMRAKSERWARRLEYEPPRVEEAMPEKSRCQACRVEVEPPRMG